jgi:predicted PurR-regulated permease PerM
MRKATGIHPLITLLALMVGFRLGGVGGTLLSLPTLLTVKIVLEEFYPQLFDRFKSNK